jgi:threonine dehydrogenase-like Zn-dependent dehydrogenase
VKVLVYQGVGEKSFEERPVPQITASTDATTRLVDTVTTLMLLKTVQAKKIDLSRLVTHRFPFDRILDAYDTFSRAANTRALKILIATSWHPVQG